jgi:hypothetical protein
MSEPAPSPSDRLAEQSGQLLTASKRWHPITRLVVLAGVIHLVGDAFNIATVTAKTIQAGYGAAVPLETVSNWLGAVGYSLTFFGSAAMVEFLVRIWREVAILRKLREPTDR